MVAVRVEAVGVLEVGVVHAQLLGLVVHLRDEGLLGATYALGNLVGSVVCRVDEHDAHKVVERGGTARGVARYHGVLRELGGAQGADGVKRRAALERDHGRHDLRDRGHVYLSVWVLLVEHPARLVDDDGGLCLGEAGLGGVSMGKGGMRDEGEQERCEDEQR